MMRGNLVLSKHRDVATWSRTLVGLRCYFGISVVGVSTKLMWLSIFNSDEITSVSKPLYIFLIFVLP